MLRFILSILFIICTLNMISFDLTWDDGLHLKSISWPDRLSSWLKKRS